MTSPPESVNTPPADFASRVQATLMGGALGDTFGYLVESDSLEAITSRYGPARLVDLSQAAGPLHFSDDTQMALYTVDGLLEVLEWANDGVGADINACQWLAYLRWLKTQRIPAAKSAPVPQPRWIDRQDVLHHQRHPGTACVRGLASGHMGTASRPVNPDSKGCGTVTRSAPYGLIPHVPTEAVYKMSSDSLAVAGLGLRAAAESARSRAVAGPGADVDLLARLDAALTLSAHGRTPLSGQELTNTLGLGWVAEEALAVALYSVLVTAPDAATPVEHFLAAVRLAVNHDGNSGSTGSIAGNILGAFHGEAALPGAWLQLSEGPELIRHLGAQLVKLTAGG